MADESITRADVAQAIAQAIVKQAQALATSRDAMGAAAGLKDLAEASAWLNQPNQPH